MNTQRSADRVGLPPPLDLDLELHDAGRTVGWIAGDTIGFRGFANGTEAVHAAWVAYRTLARRLARMQATRPIPIDVASLAVRQQDGEEVILADGRPIARLVRPAADSPSGPDSFGFEIGVPAPADELRVRSMAHLMYRTLRKSGLRWTLWSPAPAQPALRQPLSHPLTGRNTVNANLPRNRAASTAAAASPLVFFSALTVSLITATMAIALVMMVSLAVTVPLGVVLGAGLFASAIVILRDRMIGSRRVPARRWMTRGTAPASAPEVAALPVPHRGEGSFFVPGEPRWVTRAAYAISR